MRENTLAGTLDALGLSVERALDVANGAEPATDAEALAAPALRHAYTGQRQVGISMPAAYDAGLRLLAHTRAHPVARREDAGIWEWKPSEVPLVITAVEDARVHTATGVVTVPQVVNLLGARVDAALAPGHAPGPLYVASAGVFHALRTRLLGLGDVVPPKVWMLMEFYGEALAHVENGIVVDMSAVLRDMFAVPTVPRSLDGWMPLMGAGSVGDLALMVREATVPVLAFANAWDSRWRKMVEKGPKERRRTATDQEMAVALESRSEGQRWFRDYGLANDALLQEAALWSGRVMAGVWVDRGPSSWTLAIGEAPCRYRSGSEVTVVLWNGRACNVEVGEVGYSPAHGVLVTVRADGKDRVGTLLDRCFSFDGDEDRGAVLVRPRVPNASSAADAYQVAGRHRRAADRLSWLGYGAVKPSADREIPMDVYASAVGI